MKPGTWAAASRSSLPWSVIEAQRARIAEQRRRVTHAHSIASGEAEAIAAANADARGMAPVSADMPDRAIRALADERAAHMGRWLFSGGEVTLAGLSAYVEGLGARPGALDGLEVAGAIERAKCSRWWRRQLRRAVWRLWESGAVRYGQVGRVGGRQPYVTNVSADRVRERRASNRAVMEATQLENDAGQVMTLAELAATSTANPAIRRGELMTRISGCEKLADALGHRGVFLTLTAPSRFHSVGGTNPAFDGSTPADSHAWLCSTWAKARARLHRIGVKFYGFRVAEPHRDGCAHWHALLWAEAGQLWRLVLNLRRWWLKDSGLEPGARAHRLKAVLMRPGGAAGYCAKYVAKNIDDAGAVGTDGHIDECYRTGAQAPLIEGTAARVQAWASLWGIRQFQAIGQPPVTVWRELRRVDEAQRAGASDALARAFVAVDRDGARRADWAAYVEAQGGLMVGQDYRIRIAKEQRERVGRYETTIEPRPVGVEDAHRPGVVHYSARREWRTRGEWGARGSGWSGCGEPAVSRWHTETARCVSAVPPWTRVNNCTGLAATGRRSWRASMVAGQLIERGAPLRTWRQVIEPGGSQPERARDAYQSGNHR